MKNFCRPLILILLTALAALLLPTAARAQDSDADGMPDSYELTFGCLMPYVADADVDYDSDGLTSLEEYTISPNLNPCDDDTDGDLFDDSVDCAQLDPDHWLDCGVCADADGDNWYSVGCDQYSTINGPDCDDANNNTWDTCATCVDTDLDGWFGLCNSYDEASTVVIGSGSDPWEYPLYTYYQDARTQVIYLASEIGSAGTITSIALDVTTIPGQEMENFTIRMKHTGLSAYSSNSWEGPASGWTTVYQADETITATGWRTFTLTTPFVYNGTQNLMVDFSFNNSSWSDAGYVNSTDSGADRSLTYESDSGDGDPLNWDGADPPSYQDTYVPNLRINFGGAVKGPDCDDANTHAWDTCATCVDADADGWFGVCNDYTGISGPDCNNGNANTWNTCGTCVDADADGWFWGCNNYTGINGPDCDDTNTSAWDTCATCVDADLDSWFALCNSYNFAPFTFVIGAGGDSFEFPLYTEYEDARTQVIYLASEIGSAGTITSIALDVTTIPGQAMENFTIRMKHTGLSAYSSNSWEGPASGWTTVYQADETIIATGWRTFTLTTPFVYNGTQNLMVDFSFNNSSYSDAGFVNSTDSGADRSLSYESDSEDGDPLDWDGADPPSYQDTYVPNLRINIGRAVNGPDCDDANVRTWDTCATCLDADNDTWWVGCNQYPDSQGSDCSDANARTWDTCAACMDADADTWWIGCNQYPDGLGPDCDDGNGSVLGCTPVTDTDGDGMPDAYELLYSCLIPSVIDSGVDYDGDGLSSLEEYTYSPDLDPCEVDTDGDGMDDGWEMGTSCMNPLLMSLHNGSFNTPDNAWDVFVSGDYAYVADENSGLQIINVSNPASPSWVGGVVASSSSYSLYVSGIYAYLVDAFSGLRIINVSNPANPTVVGTYDTPDQAHGVFVSGNYAYVADAWSGLQIINVFSPASPTLVGTYNTPHIARDVVVSGDYAYVADAGSGLQIINVSNPALPTLAGSYDTPDEAWSVDVSGDYAYVADYSSGLLIIDVSNPANPTLVGTYNTTGNATGVYVSGNHAYLADGNFGLQVINISNPAAPTLAGAYDTPGYAANVFLSDDYAFVADVGGGLQTLALYDHDFNGLTDLIEYSLDSNPCAADSDADGMDDGWENSNVCVSVLVGDSLLDGDSDGLTNFAEYERGTAPCDPDTDDDGLEDGDEVNNHLTNPLIADTDGDNHLDGADCNPLDRDNWVSCATCIDLDVDTRYWFCDAYVNHLGPDCDDANPHTWDTCGTCMDADADSWYGVCNVYTGISGPDCNDANARTWDTCASCHDADADGWFGKCDDNTGLPGPDCSPFDSTHWNDCGLCVDADRDSRGAGCNLGPDCDDSNTNAWTTCATCMDADADSWYGTCDRYILSGGTVTIGTGTYADVVPLSTNYHDSRYQTIYLASEIGKSGIISSLSLYVTTVPGQVMNNFTIRLKHTTRSNHATRSWEGPKSGWTTVYQANETIASTGWVAFYFSNPFNYNGTDNLMVDFSFNNSSASSAGTVRQSYADLRSIFYRTNSLDGDPFAWSGVSNPTPTLFYEYPNVRLNFLGSISGPDCNDTNPDTWNTCATCQDSDGDNWWNGCNQYVSADGPDCNDANPRTWNTCATCLDTDADNWYGVCNNYSGINGPDCNNSNARTWDTCATCVDTDFDNWYGVCNDYTGINGPDCNDSNTFAWSACATCVDVDADAWYGLCDRYSSGTGTSSIGAGTSSTDLPLSTDYNISRTEMIYLASEIARSGIIASLTLELTTAPGQVMNNFTIRLKHTTLTNHSTASWQGPDSGWTTVYQTNEPIGANGWRTFTFTTPFIYNGTDNLMVDISFNNTSASSAGTVKYISASSRSIYYRTYSTSYGDPLNWSGTSNPIPTVWNYIPNLRLNFGVSINGPDCDDTIATGPTCHDTCTPFYLDQDNDLYGDPANSVNRCLIPAGYVVNNTDCGPTDANNWNMCATCLDADADSWYIGCNRYQTVNGPDCDDTIATGPTCHDTCTTFYLDQDSDAYGDPASFAVRCSAGGSYVADWNDCAPTVSTIYPGAPEACDSIDNQCPADAGYGVIDEGCSDFDGDGLSDVQDIIGTNPNDPDTDNDGLNDGDEVNLHGTNPLGWDSDNDALPDAFEVANISGHPAGKNMNPLAAADATLDFDGDGITNTHEYWNGTSLWAANPAGYVECGYWGEADNDGFITGNDRDMLLSASIGNPTDYSNVFPPTGETQDLDGDGWSTGNDVDLLNAMMVGDATPLVQSRPAALDAIDTCAPTLAVGDTCHVSVAVLNTRTPTAGRQAGIAVVFTVDPSSTGSATIFGGEGAGDVGGRYDLSTSALSSPAGVSRAVVRADGAGTVKITARVPQCGTEVGVGRSSAEIVLPTFATVTVP